MPLARGGGIFRSLRGVVAGELPLDDVLRGVVAGDSPPFFWDSVRGAVTMFGFRMLLIVMWAAFRFTNAHRCVCIPMCLGPPRELDECFVGFLRALRWLLLICVCNVVNFPHLLSTQRPFPPKARPTK